jgi:ATP-binding protein involved in chromosome partitioning
MSSSAPTPIPMAGPGAPAQQGGPADPRAAERLKRRLRIINQMKRIKHKLIVASGKGGVGKSTVAANLAASLAAAGHKVGILDMDLTGPNIPLMLGIDKGELVETADGLVPWKVNDHLVAVSMQFLLQDPDQAVIWRGPIKMQIIGQFLGDVAWGDLDYLVIDLPPGTSDEPLSVAQNIPDADGVILVTTPQEVAVGDVRKSAQFVQKLQLPVLGVIENMSGLTLHGTITPAAPGTTVTVNTGHGALAAQTGPDGTFTLTVDVFKRGGGQAMAERLAVPFLGAVPLDLAVMHAGDEGKPFALQDGDSPAKQAFRGIVEKLTAGHSA